MINILILPGEPVFKRTVSHGDVCLCVNVDVPVCSEATCFFSLKQHYRDFVKLDLTYNLKNHLVCDLQA